MSGREVFLTLFSTLWVGFFVCVAWIIWSDRP